MRRRLTLALTGVALLAVVLVGAGVLLLAQFGARQEAERLVERQLLALAEVAGQFESPERIRPALGRLAEGFEIADARLVAVQPDGTVVELGAGGGLVATLDAEGLERFAASQPVIVSRERQTTGFLRLDGSLGRGPLGRAEPAVMVRHDISPLAPQARVWFALSAGGVLLAATLLSRWLATRFARPLEEIEAATARIAEGDLSVRVNAAGDDEFGQLGRAVNRMTEHLEHSQAAEREFLMSVSHDLRTPLTAIRGYAEALQDGATDDTQRAGNVIGDHADRLGHLVDDLLDLARMNRSEFLLTPVPIDVSPLVAGVLDGLAPRATAAKVVFDRQLPSTVALADPVRLEQVVANLVDNALKFAAGRIRVSVDVDGPAIVVADDGPGIDDADLPFVFDRLYVTKAQPRRSENSSGLGLAIVRQLTTAMGGTVVADRDPELGGTRMTVRLSSA